MNIGAAVRSGLSHFTEGFIAMKLRCCFLLFFLLCAAQVPAQAPVPAGRPHQPLSIAVFSDPHLYSTSLGTTGSAFLASLNSDRKMLLESEAILKSAVAMVQAANPALLIIPGDLTKDGEKVNHQLMAAYLKTIQAGGTKIFVIPGNHDINNPHACRYNGDSAIAIDRVQPEDFRNIYAGFGYADAIAKDTSSLSYVAEPVPGLWLLGMDACRYAENVTYPVTGGKFSPATLAWITARLAEAKAQQKLVIGFMHHSVLEHYTGENQIFPEYVVENNLDVAKLFSDYGMQVVFTGHYHAQDITLSKFGAGADFYDIETGSLLTYPCPIRFISLDAQNGLAIASRFVTAIDYPTNNIAFQDYAHEYLLAGLQTIAMGKLTDAKANGGFGFSTEQAQVLAPQFAQAFCAHYRGDENPDSQTVATIQGYLGSSNPDIVQMGQYLSTFWTDLAPADNDITLTLAGPAGIGGGDVANNRQFRLLNNYPNPFNPATMIRYELSVSAKTRVSVFDEMGREVRVLTDGMQAAGQHEVRFFPGDLPSGVYYYRLISGSLSETKKMLLVK
jgi:3',5'-cyclic AMP phosphodiesterase CpdA